MSTTSHLGITLVEQSQAQKEVTVNQALTEIDAILNTGAKTLTLATPPGSPADGDVYIVAASPTGAWAGQANNVAYYSQTWQFITPNEGMTLWVNDQDLLYTFNGTAWVTPSVSVSGPGTSVSDSAIVLFSGTSGTALKAATGSGFVKVASGVYATESAVDVSGSDVTGTLAAARFPALTGDVTTSAGSLSASIGSGKVTYAKIQNETASTLLGNPTGSSAAPSEIILGTGLSFSGSVLNVTAGGSGTVTSVATGSGLTGGTITTSGTVSVATNGISNALFRQSGANTLVGNATGSTANVADITLGATLAFSSGALQTDALTGDVTTSANSFATTIASNAVTTGKINNSAVTYAKIQNETADTLLGNPTGSSAAPSEITLGATLAFSSGALQTDALSGDVTSSANSFATTIASNAVTTSKINNAAVTYAKIQNETASTLLGNPTGSSAAPSEIILGTGLSFSGSVLNVTAGGSGTVTSVATGSGLTGGTITTSGTVSVAANGISNALFRQSGANTLVGNATGSTANVADITLGATLAFSSGALQTDALTGDVTSSANSFATTIASNAVTTSKINNAAVTYAKIQNETASTLLGNPTGSSAAPSEITLGSGLSFSGTTLTVTAGGSGTVTSVATGSGLTGGTITTSGTVSVATNGISNALFRQSGALSVVGNGGSSTANVADIAGTANQVLRVNGAGTALAFGAIDVSQSAAVTNILAAANGGTSNGFTAFSGPASSTKTFTLPNASDTVACLGQTNAFTKQQYFSATSLTDGATISWDASANQVASVTLGGNRTLANPTNLVNGGTYILTVKQDGTGSRTLSYGTAYKWPGGTAPTLTTAASAVDILSFVSDGTNMYGVSQLNFQ